MADRILLKAVFWDYPEFNDEKKLRVSIATNSDIKKWILSRFLEHGRVIDTLKFFKIADIEILIDKLRINDYTRKKWNRLIEFYALKENKSCYASSIQSDLLVSLFKKDSIGKNFFLTGGTALSVFYLHHRKSDDLDLFTFNEVDLSEIDFLLQREFDKIIKTNDTGHLKSYLINEVKVEFVIDRLSLHDEKEVFKIDEQNYFRVDSVRNISSNKLCTLVSRSEIKDYIDFYFLSKDGFIENFNSIYSDSADKDTIFEDVPTVAFKIEEGFAYIINNYGLIPELIRDFNSSDFEKFYQNLIKKLYSKVN